MKDKCDYIGEIWPDREALAQKLKDSLIETIQKAFYADFIPDYLESSAMQELGKRFEETRDLQVRPYRDGSVGIAFGVFGFEDNDDDMFVTEYDLVELFTTAKLYSNEHRDIVAAELRKALKALEARDPDADAAAEEEKEQREAEASMELDRLERIRLKALGLDRDRVDHGDDQI